MKSRKGFKTMIYLFLHVDIKLFHLNVHVHVFNDVNLRL
jgi:hypothetical protein